MKTHTTNYKNTFIAVADDCPVTQAEVPPVKGKPSVANLQYDMISENPYTYTSDEVVFGVFAARNEVPASELEETREQFFSKGQPCLRASPLGKRYGWGIHANADEKIALYALGTPEYEKFLEDETQKTVKAMKSAR